MKAIYSHLIVNLNPVLVVTTMLLNLKVARLLVVASGRGINLPHKHLLGESSGDCVLSPEIEIVKSSPIFEYHDIFYVILCLGYTKKPFQTLRFSF